MKIHQKRIEKLLNKEYELTFYDFLAELREEFPYLNAIRTESFNDSKAGPVEVYTIFTHFINDGKIAEKDWDASMEVNLEVWVATLPNGNIYIR